MPEWGYSIVGLDEARVAKASGRELRISHKAAIEICNAIKGMKLQQAKQFLRAVIAKEQPVPYRKYNHKVGHKRQLKGGAYAGRYPVKAANKILQVLENAEANAEDKGFDIENLRIIHASAYPGMKMKRYMPRAFGRSSPKFETLTHVEIVLEKEVA